MMVSCREHPVIVLLDQSAPVFVGGGQANQFDADPPRGVGRETPGRLLDAVRATVVDANSAAPLKTVNSVRVTRGMWWALTVAERARAKPGSRSSARRRRPWW